MAVPIMSFDTRSIAYLGPRASYTHQAALSLLDLNKHLQDPLRLEPLPTIPSLFNAVETGQHPYAICPAENSTNGPVGFTLDLVARAGSRHPNVLVMGELRVRVRHCLIVRALAATTKAEPDNFSQDSQSLTGAVVSRLERLESLTTHPQAWTQCTRFLEFLDGLREAKGLAKPRRIDSMSTSGAALGLVGKDSSMDIAQQAGESGAGHEDRGAISSALAADLDPSLEVLLAGLEDSKDNVTRFYVLGRRDAPNPLGLHLVERPHAETVTRKAIISFRLTKSGERIADKKTQPGTLARALATFENHQLNLTSISARPSGQGPWDYTFVVELEIPRGVTSERAVLETAVQDLGDVTGGDARVGGLWAWNEDWNC